MRHPFRSPSADVGGGRGDSWTQKGGARPGGGAKTRLAPPQELLSCAEMGDAFQIEMGDKGRHVLVQNGPLQGEVVPLEQAARPRAKKLPSRSSLV